MKNYQFFCLQILSENEMLILTLCWVYSGGLRPQYFGIQLGLWRMRQVESSFLHHIQGLMVQIPKTSVKYWMKIQEL
jgi:hypothetical protein